MKKIYSTILLIAVLSAVIPTLVLADEVINETPTAEAYIKEMDTDDEVFTVVEDERDNDIFYDSSDESEKDTMDRFSSEKPGKKYVKIRGKWGAGKEKTPDGFWGGRIILRTTEEGKRFGVFNGLYNKTGSEEKHQLVGIMKKGYFNGKIINDDGKEIKLTGLYTFDRENKLLKMQWMIPQYAGWAAARVQIGKE